MSASTEPALGRFEGTATVFLTSAASLIVEIVAGRMLAPYVGMSLYTWTSVIAVVLAGLSLGHWIGGWATDRLKGSKRIFLAAILLGASASTLAAIAILPGISGFVLTRLDTAVTGITALTLSAFFIPSVAAGIPSPLVAAAFVEANPETRGRALGGLFAAGAIGSIVGTLSAGYLFISWLGSTKTLIACAGLYALLALVIGAQAGRKAGIASLAVVLALGAAGYGLRGAAKFCDVESRYFCIRSIDISAQAGERAQLMVLDHLAHSMSSRDNPESLLWPYPYMSDAIARAEKGEDFSAFFIGGGAFSLPRAWAARGIDTTVAEIDPEVTAMAEREFWFDPATTRVIHRDARIALKDEPAESFDVIVGDAFTDVAVPPHLVTKEFAALVASRLKPDGIYILHFVAPSSRPEALYAMKKTLKTAFTRTDMWLDGSPIYPDSRRSFLFVARKTDTEPTMGANGTWHPLDSAEIDRRAAASDARVLSDDYAPIDRLVGMAGIGVD
ncbi:fused MFS/spermidine synthase [Tepidamorphus sp. 3E244]|uniref:fused MFS/spermidine synthase n=1 Tax=Tepidamorphus sp. 3E244 TaxID=3385498 RepID=UPI0038FCE9C7